MHTIIIATFVGGLSHPTGPSQGESAHDLLIAEWRAFLAPVRLTTPPSRRGTSPSRTYSPP